MYIITATNIDAGAIRIDRAMPAAVGTYEVVRPMPQLRVHFRLAGTRYAFVVTNESFQITIRDPAFLPQALEIMRVVFYGGALPRLSMCFTNLNLTFLVPPYFSLDIGRLRAAVAAGRCPGLHVWRCARPRAAASIITYLACSQENGAGEQGRVNIIVGQRRVTIIGVCKMRAVAFAGAIRRSLAASGAFDGPHGFVDHRDALWPLIGAADTPEIAQALSYMVRHPVAPEARAPGPPRPLFAGKSSRTRAPRRRCRSG